MGESVGYVRLGADTELMQLVRPDKGVRNEDLRVIREKYRFGESREIRIFRRNLAVM